MFFRRESKIKELSDENLLFVYNSSKELLVFEEFIKIIEEELQCRNINLITKERSF